MLRPGNALRVAVRNPAWQAVIPDDTQCQRSVSVRARQLRQLVPVELAVALLGIAAKDPEVMFGQSTHA